MHALAGERVKVDRGRRDERLAFAGAHLGDRAFMQNEAADHLNVEMTLLERALRRLSHGGKSGRHEIVQRLARGELGAKLGGLRQELLVAQGLELGLERIDRRDLRPVALQPAVVRGTEDPLHHRVEFQRRAEHFRPFRFRLARRRWRRHSARREQAMGARTKLTTIKSAKKAGTAHFRAVEQGCP